MGEGVRGGGGVGGGGGGLGGGGQGTFHPPCHILHYHMVLRPEGTSHNKRPRVSADFPLIALFSIHLLTSSAPCPIDEEGDTGNAHWIPKRNPPDYKGISSASFVLR